MAAKERLQELLGDSLFWVTELFDCVQRWETDNLIDFFITRPWSEVETAFVMGTISRDLLTVADIPLSTQTVAALCQTAASTNGINVNDEITARFERIILINSDGPTISSELEAFITDALLLRCAAIMSTKTTNPAQVIDQQMKDIPETLKLLRKANSDFIEELIRNDGWD